jgi:hypothetical protein
MDLYEPAYLYTIQEARNLVPEIRPLLAAMQVEHRRMRDEMSRLNELTPAMRQNGHAPQAEEHERLIMELGESLREKLDQFELMGIEVKDIEHGVIDFPSERDGHIIFLCWQVDEETITHWHEIDTGFAGRQLLED